MGKQIIVEGGSEGKEREEALYFPKQNNYMKITVTFGLGCSAVSDSVGYHGAFTDFSRLGTSDPSVCQNPDP